MKTINVIFLTIFFLFFAHALQSQTPSYYKKTNTFVENGYVYQCDVAPSGMVTLYNKTNKYTYEKYALKSNGARITSPEILLGKLELIEPDNWTKFTCMDIANRVFSDEERERVATNTYQVVMTVDTSTGKVIEVHFCFFYDDSFGSIPVSTFRKVELELKEQIWFIPTKVGKALKFIKRGWMQEVYR